MEMSSPMESEKCVVCSSQLVDGLAKWHKVCQACGYEKSSLSPAINTDEVHERVDEVSRESGLGVLRRHNFLLLLNHLKRLRSREGATLLDVGAAHGWFLDVAGRYYVVQGIEPDRTVFEAARRNGKPIRLGYFPDVLEENEKFDIIVFNDVIEHIPDIRRILGACYAHLNQDGLLLLNLPNSKGFFYIVAKLFMRGGLTSPFERLWQKDMPSPHVHYFHPGNLSELVSSHGFEEVDRGILPSLVREGLYTRISYVGGYGTFIRLAIYMAVLLVLPFLRYMPNDIAFCIYEKR